MLRSEYDTRRGAWGGKCVVYYILYIYIYMYIYIYIYTRIERALRAHIGPWALVGTPLGPPQAPFGPQPSKPLWDPSLEGPFWPPSFEGPFWAPSLGGHCLHIHHINMYIYIHIYIYIYMGALKWGLKGPL